MTLVDFAVQEFIDRVELVEGCNIYNDPFELIQLAFETELFNGSYTMYTPSDRDLIIEYWDDIAVVTHSIDTPYEIYELVLADPGVFFTQVVIGIVNSLDLYLTDSDSMDVTVTSDMIDSVIEQAKKQLNDLKGWLL